MDETCKLSRTRRWLPNVFHFAVMFAIGLIELHAAESTLRELHSAYVPQRPTFQSVDENTIAHGQRRFPEVGTMTYHRRDLTGRTYIFGSATGGIGINDRGPVAAVGADRGCEYDVCSAVTYRRR